MKAVENCILADLKLVWKNECVLAKAVGMKNCQILRGPLAYNVLEGASRESGSSAGFNYDVGSG